MSRSFLVALIGASLLGLAACGGNGGSPGTSDAHSSVSDAAERTLAAGPADLRVRILGGAEDYRLRGQFDPAGGYRACAAVTVKHSFDTYYRGQSVWLQGRHGTYNTLIGSQLGAGHPTCPHRGWLDDHPPTLPLYDTRLFAPPRGGQIGGEDFLHLALLTLTQMRSAALEVAPLRGPGAYQVVVDFGRFDRKPPTRDEDAWTLRPLARMAGRTPVDVHVDSKGLLDRLSFRAPSPIKVGPVEGAVRVGMRLLRLGEAPRVPWVHAFAME